MTEGAGAPAAAPDPKAALSWAMRQLRGNASAYASLAAVVTVIQFLQQIATQPLLVVLQDCLDATSPGQKNACQTALSDSLPASVATLVLVVLAVLATAGIQRAALGSTRNVAPTFRQMFTTHDLAHYVLYSLAYGILVGLGILFCVLPGIAAYVLLQIGFFFVLDRGMGALAGIRSSAKVAMANLGPAFSVALVNVAALLLGSLFYGIPTLVTLPFACLFTAHMYRQLTHEPVW